MTIARVPLGLSYWRPLEVVGPFALGPMIVVTGIREQMLLWVLGETDSSSNFCHCKALMLRLFPCNVVFHFQVVFFVLEVGTYTSPPRPGLCFMSSSLCVTGLFSILLA